MRGIIPTPRNQHPLPQCDRPAYREHNRVERLIDRLKSWRRVATRYDKRAVHDLAFILLATLWLWLWFAYRP